MALSGPPAVTRLALAVSTATQNGVADSPVLLQAAAAAGITARLIDWRGDGWGWADAVLLHAPWDYTQDVHAFTQWLRPLSARTVVFNPYSTVAANTHKSYLLDLVDAGLPLPPTRLLRPGHRIDAAELRSTFGSAPVIVKPAVGAGGRGLRRLPSIEELLSGPALAASAAPGQDLLVQAFAPSVADGEYSLVMIAGKPSHLIRKTPAAGQFRVQATYGGTERRVDLDDTAAHVEQLVGAHVDGLAYARIDYVLDEHRQPLLMELELTEPDLFLRHAPEAAGSLVQHVQSAAAL